MGNTLDPGASQIFRKIGNRLVKTQVGAASLKQVQNVFSYGLIGHSNLRIPGCQRWSSPMVNTQNIEYKHRPSLRDS